MRALSNEKLAIYISCNLIRVRKKSGLTQEEIADMTGINRALYAKYETGKCCVGISNLVKIAYALNTTVDELLFGVLGAMQEESDY